MLKKVLECEFCNLGISRFTYFLIFWFNTKILLLSWRSLLIRSVDESPFVNSDIYMKDDFYSHDENVEIQNAINSEIEEYENAEDDDLYDDWWW